MTEWLKILIIAICVFTIIPLITIPPAFILAHYDDKIQKLLDKILRRNKK